MRPTSYLIPWSFLCVDIFAFFILYQLGFYGFVMSDTSYISAATFILYFASNLFLFGLVYFENVSKEIQIYLSRLAWWTVSLFQGLGLLGTLIGFYYLFKLFFPDLDFTNIEEFQNNLTNLLPSLAIALITSIAGITCSLIFSFKLMILNNATEV